MAKVTQKRLIEQLKQLKEIKPRKEWAILLKSQIFAEQQSNIVSANPARLTEFMNVFSGVSFGSFFQRKLAYSFAVIMFLIVGIFGFAEYTVPGDLLFPVRQLSEQSEAALTGQIGSKNDVATLNSRINDLAQVTKQGKKSSIPSAESEINALVKNLKNNPISDPATMKQLASSLKTLADVPGVDLTTNSDVKDLYQTVVKNQIDDLKKTTLTDDQNNILTQAEDLYSQGKYTDALEKILMINK